MDLEYVLKVEEIGLDKRFQVRGKRMEGIKVDF